MSQTWGRKPTRNLRSKLVTQYAQKHKSKGRNDWSRDPQEQTHEDKRSKRERSRADKERKAVQTALDDELDAIDRILDENEEALSTFEQMPGE